MSLPADSQISGTQDAASCFVLRQTSSGQPAWLAEVIPWVSHPTILPGNVLSHAELGILRSVVDPHSLAHLQPQASAMNSPGSQHEIKTAQS